MSQWTRFFGLDWFDTLVHAVVTVGVMVAVVDATRSPGPMALVGVAGLTIFAVRRRLALAAMRRTGEISGETSGAHRRVETEERLAELESLYGRIAELEERLDFSERLLAQRNEPGRVGGPAA